MELFKTDLHKLRFKVVLMSNVIVPLETKVIAMRPPDMIPSSVPVVEPCTVNWSRNVIGIRNYVDVLLTFICIQPSLEINLMDGSKHPQRDKH